MTEVKKGPVLNRPFIVGKKPGEKLSLKQPLEMQIYTPHNDITSYEFSLNKGDIVCSDPVKSERWTTKDLPYQTIPSNKQGLNKNALPGDKVVVRFKGVGSSTYIHLGEEYEIE